jgi:hypothetical protein
VCSRWEELGGAPTQVELAAERRELTIDSPAERATRRLSEPVR